MFAGMNLAVPFVRPVQGNVIAQCIIESKHGRCLVLEVVR